MWTRIYPCCKNMILFCTDVDISTFALYIPLGKNCYSFLFQKPPVLGSHLWLSLIKKDMCSLKTKAYAILILLVTHCLITYSSFNNSLLIQQILLRTCYLPGIVWSTGITKLLVHSFSIYKALFLRSCSVLRELNGEPDRQGSHSTRKATIITKGVWRVFS